MGKTNKNKKNPFKKVRLTWGEFDPNEKVHEKQSKKRVNKKQELKKLIDFEDEEEYEYNY
jgi:hypothetical protein